jgi:3-carboxy-cis,cis-muconate cycloisomerase
MSLLLRVLPATTPEMLAAFGDASLLRAALAFEAALAAAQAGHGVVPPAYAAAIAASCDADKFDIAVLAEEAAHAGTLAIPLVARLRALVAERDKAAAAAVHLGATSQDVADTALMLQAKAGMSIIVRDLGAIRASLAALAATHAETPMLGRTLLQAALPISFGLKIGSWLAGLDAAAARLAREAESALALQFGGACGTRAGLGGKGAAIAAHMAAALGLQNPALPWHAQRQGIAGLGTALASLAGALGKIARDISLLAQTEIGELAEPRMAGRGGSSAMAHKRNPTGCQVALSAAARAPGLAATLLGTLPAEHERGLGGWQAEAPVLADLFLLTHGALAALVPVIAGLEIDTGAMRRNLEHAGVGDDIGEAALLVQAMFEGRKNVLF